jgi:hypothetical protein
LNGDVASKEKLDGESLKSDEVSKEQVDRASLKGGEASKEKFDGASLKGDEVSKEKFKEASLKAVSLKCDEESECNVASSVSLDGASRITNATKVTVKLNNTSFRGTIMECCMMNSRIEL